MTWEGLRGWISGKLQQFVAGVATSSVRPFGNGTSLTLGLWLELLALEVGLVPSAPWLWFLKIEAEML